MNIQEVRTIEFILNKEEFSILFKVLDNLTPNFAGNQLNINPKEYKTIEEISEVMRDLY